MPSYAYIGCRTSQRRGARGRGIKVFKIDETGAWSLLQTLIVTGKPVLADVQRGGDAPVCDPRRR